MTDSLSTRSITERDGLGIPQPCPEWPDCDDDEGPCYACAQYAAWLHDRDLFNEGVLYGLRYQLSGMRGEVNALEGRIHSLEDCLEHPERQSPYEVWLSEQQEK